MFDLSLFFTVFTIMITYSKLFQAGTERKPSLANLFGGVGLGKGLKGGESSKAQHGGVLVIWMLMGELGASGS